MICSRPACPNRVHRRGWCRKHADITPHGLRPAEPARAHLARLRCRYDQNALITLTGATKTTLTNIARGKHPTLKVAVWAPIMALPVPVRPVAGCGYLPAAGSKRRIEALAVMGWPQHYLADRLGIPLGSVNHVRTIAGTTSAKAAAIADLYDELHHQRGPSALTRSRSLTKGWAPPAAWDDETIDDPDTRPDLGTPTRLTFADRYLELREIGETSDVRIAAKLGLTVASLKRECARYRLARAS